MGVHGSSRVAMGRVERPRSRSQANARKGGLTEWDQQGNTP